MASDFNGLIAGRDGGVAKLAVILSGDFSGDFSADFSGDFIDDFSGDFNGEFGANFTRDFSETLAVIINNFKDKVNHPCLSLLHPVCLSAILITN